MPRRNFRRSSGRPLRPMDWGGSSYDCNDVAVIPACGSGCITIMPVSIIRESFTDPTLMAVLLAISIAGNATGTATGGQFVYGLIPWQDTDDLPPTGSDCPNPFDQPQLDWIGVGVLPYQNAVGSFLGATTGQNGDGMNRFKARRRLGNSHSILLSVYNNGSAQVNMRFFARLLFKE